MHKISSKITVRAVLLLAVFALFSCTRRDRNKEEVAETAQKSIVVTNFVTGAFVKELVSGDAIIIYDVIPVGMAPNTWVPTKKTVDTISESESLVIIAGNEPSWVTSLPNKIKVVNALSNSAETCEAGYNPSQAIAMFKKIETELALAFPDLKKNTGASAFLNKLKENEEKWSALGNQDDTPSTLKSGEIRPGRSLSFLNLMEQNYKLYTTARDRIAKQKLHSQSYAGKIVPIIERSCIECHDEIDEEGDLNFEIYLTEKAAEQNPDLWEKVAKVIELEQMPPIDHEHQLSAEDKASIHAWVDSLTQKWDSGEMGADPGRTTVHRLNRNEYNYTIRDLFGLSIRPADNFPEEGSGEGGFDNNADALYLPPLLMENYFESVAKIVEAVYSNPKTRSRYLMTNSSLSPSESAEKALTYWASLIYRKPADAQEVGRLVALFKTEFETKKRYDEAMKMPLFSMLLSPNFLYRSTLTEVKDGPYLINDFELASKLSYFLWSSLPDKELFALATEGKLSDPSVIEEQVKRMLQDDKSKTLGMHFGGQWFGWEELRSSANPDKKKYPEFTFPLRVSLYQESMQFFNHLVKENESAYELLDSEYTFLNDRLAKFYKISGVTGSEFRLVKLTDRNRGGVLGMGSVLTATSLPLRSSPSIRGAFVIKDILGINLPAAPMNIPQLPEDDREIKGETLRERLKQHRQDANCINCHEMIDPSGFGLEGFDAIGRFRTQQNGLPLDTAGTLPDGTHFTTPAGLKKALLNEKELFARNMVEKMLSYALGRDLTPYDRPEVKKITDKVIADNGRIQTAFIEVAKSYPFRYRRSGSTNTEKTAPTPTPTEKVKPAPAKIAKPPLSEKAKRRRERKRNEKNQKK